MPVFIRRGINPNFKYINVGKVIKRSLRISKKKRIRETKKYITIVDNGIHTHKMNTSKFFK